MTTDDMRFSYLDACFTLLKPWEDVMEETAQTRAGVGPLPPIEPTYFFFLSSMWLEKRRKNLAKMAIGDAARLVPGLSPSRASRFVSDTVDYGYLVEEHDLRDKRKKYVYLSPETEDRISTAIDKSIVSFKSALSLENNAAD
ncbi:hypothetical protein [uncultured Roseobacter sp.]|uniref:hypothetical protein n=1 Tax=uncultured Roseobacter sp. TaxID=114847 RepID=UPI0026310421|nr:hypothetical protein [uncultured Roseobacter sp.]